MVTPGITAHEIASALLNWVMVSAFFATQAFIATGGVQRLIGA